MLEYWGLLLFLGACDAIVELLPVAEAKSVINEKKIRIIRIKDGGEHSILVYILIARQKLAMLSDSALCTINGR